MQMELVLLLNVPGLHGTQAVPLELYPSSHTHADCACDTLTTSTAQHTGESRSARTCFETTRGGCPPDSGWSLHHTRCSPFPSQTTSHWGRHDKTPS